MSNTHMHLVDATYLAGSICTSKTHLHLVDDTHLHVEHGLHGRAVSASHREAERSIAIHQ